mgnify:CR=1 FL=1
MKEILLFVIWFCYIFCTGQTFCHTPQYTDEYNRMNVDNSLRNNREVEHSVNNSMFRLRLNSHEDGIDIYMFPDDISNPGGMANGVGVHSEFSRTG